MKRHYQLPLLLLFFMLTSLFVPAQVTQQWTRRYNGPGSSADRASALAIASNWNQEVHVLGNGGFKIYEKRGFEWSFYRPMFYDPGKRVVIDSESEVYFTSGNSLFKVVETINPQGLGDNGGDVLELDGQDNVYTGGQKDGNFVTARYYKGGQLAWAKQYNGPGNGNDSLTALAIDTAGNVYVCGISRDHAGVEAFTTIKYDSLGNQQWVRNHTAPGAAYDLALDRKGNIYVTGQSGGNYLTLGYDPDGNLLWATTYDGPAKGQDAAYAIVADAAGNTYVTGGSTGNGSEMDYATLKYNASGNLLWEKRYNGPGNGRDLATLMEADPMGNIILTGSSMGNGTGEDYATLKYDPAGNLLWASRYNSPVPGEGGAHDLVVDKEGSVFVTGVATVKYDAAGKELWAIKYYKDGHGWDVANDITTDKLGFIYVTGSSEQGFGDNPDYTTIKYDGSGREYFVSRYNGPGNGEDVAVAVVADGQGNTYVTGWSHDPNSGLDIATIKYDSVGKQEWLHRYNGPGNGEDKAADMAIDSQGNVYVTGSSQGTGTGFDYVTIKYDPSGQVLWTSRHDGNGQDDKPAKIAVTPAGQVYVTGQGQVKGNSAPGGYLTVSYDTNGRERWVRGYGTGAGATSLALDGAGNTYITGGLIDTGANADYVTLKYDAAGNKAWVSRYNGTTNSFDKAKDIVVDKEGNVYVTGGSDGVFGEYYFQYFTTIRYDHLGRQQWVSKHSGRDQPNYFNQAIAIALDSSGNVVVTGESEASYTTLAYDKTGRKLWEQRYQYDYFDGDRPNAITVDPSGNILVTGKSDSGEGPLGDRDDYLTIKYTSIPGGIVHSLLPINAETGREAWAPGSPDTINLAWIGNVPLSFRAYTEPQALDSLIMELSGLQHHRQMEKTAPYALFGNNKDQYAGRRLPLGDYTLKATPWFNGAKGATKTFRFTVIDHRVLGFMLVDADTNRDIDTLKPGQELNLSALPTRRLNIRALTATPQAGSVVFNLNGTRKVEDIAPYALFGDRNGDYHPWTPTPGYYRLSATPFTGLGGYGLESPNFWLGFTVIDSLSLSGLTLVNAASDRVIGPLADGAIIDLAQTPQFNILAQTGVGRTASVRFDVNGKQGYRLENNPPFALAANRGADFFPWPATPGSYTITATPFGASNGSGKEGTPVRVTITVIDTRSGIPTVQSGDPYGKPGTNEKATLQVLPNPLAGSGTIRFGVPRTTQVRITLVDAQGRERKQLFSGKADGGALQNRAFNLQGIRPGVYLCRLQTADGRTLSEKVVVQ